MIGGYVAFVLYSLGIHPLLGVPAAAIVLFVLGWAIYRLVIFRVVDRDLFISLLATFGLSILIQQLLNQIFTSDVQSADSGLDTLFLFEGLVVVPHIKVVAFALTLAIAGCLVVFLKSSRLGQAIRATAQNARAWVIQPFQGLAYTVRSFMIVVVAGLGNLPGVIVSAFGLGAAEQLAGFILGAEFQIAFVFGLLVVVLLLRSHRLKRQRRYLK
jgi:branched-chain amino acid transport system permease protein